MEFLLQFLPIVIYFLLIIILVIGIVLGIKSIITITKVEKVVDDVNDKVQSLNSVFSIIDFTTDKLAMISEKVTNGITLFIDKIFKKGKVDEDDE